MHNVPLIELERSPAAQVIGKLARDSGLYLTHFEHRHHIPMPTQWLPDDRPDLTGEVTWNHGILKEHKYLHFRYDQPLGSLHPNHRAKWTAHELCHGLVGFSWRDDMTPLAYSLVARLSELLPVALWYFFDEVELRRCPLHYLQGALFQDHCVYCEQLALHGPRLREPEDDEMVSAGLRFVKAELAMIARSKRFGRPLPNRYATLDLNSDSLAYTAQHLKRMNDPTFRMFIELFHGPHTGMWSDLDELEGRVWGLTEALSGGLPANPLPAGREHWVAQDLGWRLLLIASQCEDREAVDALEEIVTNLSRSPAEVTPVFEGYKAIHEAFFVPDPELVFAVGYPILNADGEVIGGSDHEQLYRGINSVCPSITRALGPEGLSEQIEGFAEWDLAHPQRVPIGRRFAQFLRETAEGPLAELAHYEAVLQHPGEPDPWSSSLGWHDPEGELVRRAQGVEVLRCNIEVESLISALEAEDDTVEIPEREHWTLICSQPGGVRRVVEISEHAAHALKLLAERPLERSLLDLDDEDWETLVDAGAVTPCSWRLHIPEVISPLEDPADGPLPDALALTPSRGMWRQSRSARPSTHPEDGGLEPTPRSDEADAAREAHRDADRADHFLRALTGVIDDVARGKSPPLKSELRAAHSPSARSRMRPSQPTVVPSFTPDLRSSQEAIRDLGYNRHQVKASAPMNAFEAKLREALNSHEEESVTFESAETEADLLADESLFQFTGLINQSSGEPTSGDLNFDDSGFNDSGLEALSGADLSDEELERLIGLDHHEPDSPSLHTSNYNSNHTVAPSSAKSLREENWGANKRSQLHDGLDLPIRGEPALPHLDPLALFGERWSDWGDTSRQVSESRSSPGRALTRPERDDDVNRGDASRGDNHD